MALEAICEITGVRFVHNRDSAKTENPSELVLMSESDSDEPVFLSPDEEVGGPAKDQGASPVLRRSARKRPRVSRTPQGAAAPSSRRGLDLDRAWTLVPC